MRDSTPAFAPPIDTIGEEPSHSSVPVSVSVGLPPGFTNIGDEPVIHGVPSIGAVNAPKKPPRMR